MPSALKFAVYSDKWFFKNSQNYKIWISKNSEGRFPKNVRKCFGRFQSEEISDEKSFSNHDLDIQSLENKLKFGKSFKF